MAAAATSPAHFALRVSGLQTDFNAKNEIICFPTRRAIPIAAFPRKNE
jgi:hypothetical protein